MDGHDYEYLVAGYLRKCGYKRVTVTKGSGDYGVDVIAHKCGHTYAVQCKYYSTPVSLSAVQEAVAGKAFYGCDRAMVVTNNSFTKAAKKLADANGVVLLSGVRSEGAINWSLLSKLPKKVKIVLVCAYLFVASAIAAAAFDIIKNQPFWLAAYNVVCTSAILTFPFWVKPAIRGVINLIRFIYDKLRVKIKEVNRNRAFKSGTVAVNPEALQSYLPIESQETKAAYAKILSALPAFTPTEIQQKCDCSFAGALAILQRLLACGLISQCRVGTYTWTEKALLLGAEEHKG